MESADSPKEDALSGLLLKQLAELRELIELRFAQQKESLLSLSERRQSERRQSERRFSERRLSERRLESIWEGDAPKPQAEGHQDPEDIPESASRSSLRIQVMPEFTRQQTEVTEETQLPPAFGRRSSDLSGTNSTIRNNMNMRRSVVSTKSMRNSFVRESIQVHKLKAKLQSSSLSFRREKDAGFDPEMSLRDVAAAMVESSVFSHFVALLIVANVVLLGVEVDLTSAVGVNDAPRWCGPLNGAIVGIFVLETLLKFFACGCHGYWCGPDSAWNIFDFVIIAVSVLEVILDVVAQMLNPSVNAGQLRMMRTVRLARALRGMRVVRLFRYVSALRTLVLSIISTMGSLLWTLALLVILFYSFGVVLTQLVVDFCRFSGIDAGADPNAPPICPEELGMYWSSVSESNLADLWTLFMLLDSDQRGVIDLDEFVSGCLQLHGPAKSLQLAKMSYENKLTRKAIKQLSQEIQSIQIPLGHRHAREIFERERGEEPSGKKQLHLCAESGKGVSAWPDLKIAYRLKSHMLDVVRLMSRYTSISTLTDEELEEREWEFETALRQRNEALNSKRSSLGEKFTPLGDHQKFKEMQNFKQLRDRERYLLQEVQEEKRRRKEKRDAEQAEKPNAAMSAAIAEYFAQQKAAGGSAAPQMPKSVARTAQIHPSLASVYANAPPPPRKTAPVAAPEPHAQAPAPAAPAGHAVPDLATLSAASALPAAFRAKALASLSR
ncbi:unnamed protein product [Effrenium voratum]|nr:unnamed protein product [Effrenium voratum]